MCVLSRRFRTPCRSSGARCSENDQILNNMIIIALQVVQSIIIAIWSGVSEPLQFLLLLDTLLFLGLLHIRIRTVLQLASLVLYLELQNRFSTEFAFFIASRLFLATHQLPKPEKTLYLVLGFVYIFARSQRFSDPYNYLALTSLVILVMPTNAVNDTIDKLYELLENLPMPICIVREQGICFKTNQFVKNYSDLTLESISKLTTPQSTSSDSLETYLKKLKRQDGVAYRFSNQRLLQKCCFQNQEDDRFPLDIQVYEVLWEYKPALILIFGSQEEKKQLQELEQLKMQDQYKDELLASVSHDFKTPINGMVSIVQYLEEYSMDDHELYYLRIIRKNAYLLLFMISDILDFSRIQKNQLRLCNSTFYIQNIVNEIIELISMQALQKGIEITSKFKVEKGLMYSDPIRIKQILLNLISNSLKFTEKGKIEVSIEQHEVEKTFQITVTDTGIGIPEHVKPKLFKLYGTFDLNKGMNRNGIGLGLVICKKLIGLLGASDEIRLTSQVGVGSAFSFTINISNDQASSDSQLKSEQYVSVLKHELPKHRFSELSQVSNNFQVSQILIFNKPLTIIKEGLLQMKKTTFTSSDIPYSRNVVRLPSMVRALDEDEDKSKNKNIEQFVKLPNKRKPSEYTFGQHHSKDGTISPQKIPSIKTNMMHAVSYPFPSQTSNLSSSSLAQSHEIDETTMMINQIFNKSTSILVVDDQATNVFAFKLMLRKYEQIHVDEAYNGEQAIAKVKAKHYEYIFMDLTMPIMSGYAATERLRYMETNNQIPKNKIIALTGYDDVKEKEHCQKLGFDAFITKPIMIMDIIQVLKEIHKQ